MATIGFIENRIRPTPSPGTDYYMTIFQFLSSSYAVGEGIELLAYNTGTLSSPGIGGMNYSDEPNRVGNNSIALFRFNMANPPFYVLLQFSSGSVFGSNEQAFAPATSTTLTASLYGNSIGPTGNERILTPGFQHIHGATAIAVACRADGGNPWNGTMTIGGAVKGNPVWISGSSQLCVWPRSNGQSGSFDVTSSAFNPSVNYRRHNMFPLVSNNSMAGRHSTVSVVANRENLLIVTDVGNSGSSTFWYFGKYNARPGLVPEVPYVCLCTTGSNNDPPFKIRPHKFGTLDGTPEEGGVAHPVAAFGVRQCSLELMRTFVNTVNLHPNTMFGFPHKFDQFVYFLLLDEDPNQYGYLGTIDFFRIVYGTVPRGVSRTRQWAIFGSTTPYTAKLLIPWDNLSPAGSGGNRRGRIFSRD
jgi:hypothetical protein